MFIFILLINLLYSTSNELDIYILDVGQADSQLIVLPSGYSILVDAGEESSGSSNAKYIGARIEQILGTKHVNTLVVTHLHRDHIGSSKGGIVYLTDVYGITFDQLIDRDHGSYTGAEGNCNADTIDWNNIGTLSSTGTDWVCLVASSYSTHVLKQIREIAQQCSSTQIKSSSDSDVTIQIVQVDAKNTYLKDGVTPVGGDHRKDSKPTSENDYSICLKITYGKFVYLTCGDLDGQYETSQNGYVYDDIETTTKSYVGEIDLYHANHHGSSHSNNAEWLGVLKPTASIISCGEGNTYGHPSNEAITNMEKTSTIFATEDCNPTVTSSFSKYNIVGGDILVRVPSGATNYYVSDIKQTTVSKFAIKTSKTSGSCKK